MSDIRRAYAHDALGKCAADVEVLHLGAMAQLDSWFLALSCVDLVYNRGNLVSNWASLVYNQVLNWVSLI